MHRRASPGAGDGFASTSAWGAAAATSPRSGTFGSWTFVPAWPPMQVARARQVSTLGAGRSGRSHLRPGPRRSGHRLDVLHVMISRLAIDLSGNTVRM